MLVTKHTGLKMVTIKFTYITRVGGKHQTKDVSAIDYKTALTKFERWATKNTKSFCILGEDIINSQ